MLIEPMIQQLHQLRLRGMAAALEQSLYSASHDALTFEERLGLMIQPTVTPSVWRNVCGGPNCHKRRRSKISIHAPRAASTPS